MTSLTADDVSAGGVLVVHAFSRNNAGDGLLVDLAIERLKRVGVDEREMTLLALDPDSFIGVYKTFRAPGDPSRKLSSRVVASAVQWLLAGFGSDGPLRAAIDRSRAIVGVGGGYLRSSTVVDAAGTLLNHGHVLKAAAESTVPSIYLPQSVGPLRGVVGGKVAHWLAQLDVVCLRDDWSMDELRLATNRVRVPDMAVLAIAERMDDIRFVESASDVLMVPRRIPAPRRYEAHLRALGATLAESRWLPQARVSGAKDDARFVKRLGFEPRETLSEHLKRGRGGVVVSVRLHGALQALLHGWPVIHLAYERKGWAAMGDLGLLEYVHDARDFDPDLVLSQIDALRVEPGRQWEALRTSRERLVERSNLLTDLVRGVVWNGSFPLSRGTPA